MLEDRAVSAEGKVMMKEGKTPRIHVTVLQFDWLLILPFRAFIQRYRFKLLRKKKDVLHSIPLFRRFTPYTETFY